LSALEALCDYALYKSTFTLHYIYIAELCTQKIGKLCATFFRIMRAIFANYAQIVFIEYFAKTLKVTQCHLK